MYRLPKVVPWHTKSWHTDPGYAEPWHTDTGYAEPWHKDPC